VSCRRLGVKRLAAPPLLVLTLSSSALPVAAAETAILPKLRLTPVPEAVVSACRKAQRQVSFTVLCPARLPRASRAAAAGVKPFALGASAFGETVDIGYNAEDPRGGRFNDPARFLHFVIGPASQGVPAHARPACLGGRCGLLAPASSAGNYSGAYFGNHVRFLWRARGTRYVATLHTFGERATERLLGRILRTVRPANALVPFRPGRPSDRAMRVPAGPGEIVAGPGGLWVASRGTFAFPDFLTNRLVRVDPDTLEVASVRGLGDSELHVAAATEAVWATSARHTREGDLAAPELARVAPETGRVLARVALGGSRTDVAAGIVATPDAVWVSLIRFAGRGKLGTVLRVDPGTNRVVASLRVGKSPSAMAVEGDRLWVVDASAGSVSIVDTKANRVSGTVHLSPGLSSIASGFGSMWVTNARHGAVVRIDPSARTVLARIRIGGPSFSIAVSGDGIWTALPGSGRLVHRPGGEHARGDDRGRRRSPRGRRSGTLPLGHDEQRRADSPDRSRLASVEVSTERVRRR
jgi:streptogramin lyase